MKTYIFPGQGSQYTNMGIELFDTFPTITKIADEVLGYSIKKLCTDNIEKLKQTQFTQPALFVVNALSYRKHIEQDTTPPNFLAGHSLGEYNALEAANVFSFEDGLKLVKKRGELMSQAKKGAMAAIIGINAEEIKTILHENNLSTIDIANYNSYKQTVISGLETEVKNAQKIFETYNKAMYVPLNVNGAFHSRYMENARIEFTYFLQNFKFNLPKIPVIANVNALPYEYEENSIKINLSNQLTHSVQWNNSINFLLDQGVLEFIELGPGEILSKLVDTIRKKYKENIFSTIPSNIKNDNISTSNIEKTAQEIVDKWNKQYPIGTIVNVPGYDDTLTTKSEAMILFGHRAAIYMEGYNGYFALSEVQPIVKE